MEFDELVSKMVEASGLKKEEVLALVKSKKDELRGLVSDVGAAHIVASELGIQTLPQLRQFYKVADLRAGLTSIDIVARVLSVFPVKEFDKKGRVGQVANVIIGDGTGTTRLVLWGKHAFLTDQLERGTILQVGGAYVKVDRQSRPEIHSGNRTQFKILDETDELAKNIPKNVSQSPSEATRASIASLEKMTGGFAEIRAAVMKVVQREPFYSVCPTCGKSLTDGSCKEHGQVTPAKALVVNIVVDDGTGSLRCVLFRDAAEKLLGMTTAEAEKMAQLANNPVVVLSALEKHMGTEKIFSGRVRRNEMFDRPEMIVNKIEDVDVGNEINGLLGEMEKQN